MLQIQCILCIPIISCTNITACIWQYTLESLITVKHQSTIGIPRSLINHVLLSKPSIKLVYLHKQLTQTNNRVKLFLRYKQYFAYTFWMICRPMYKAKKMSISRGEPNLKSMQSYFLQTSICIRKHILRFRSTTISKIKTRTFFACS